MSDIQLRGDYMPGSAWDTWRKAGADYASGDDRHSEVDPRFAAVAYAESRGLPHTDVIARAWLEGYADMLIDEIEES